VTSPAPSRLRALRPFIIVALVPAGVALLRGGPRLGGLLAVMWIVIIATVGAAATSRGPQKANPYDPRGRLHG
jgi:hypothetical protein